MKKTKIILLSITTIALLSFTINNSSVFQVNLEDIGTVKQSLLKPNQFKKTQKGIWVLLNGSRIEQDTKLFELLNENFDTDILTKKDDKYFLPNASGAFIRCSNINGKGYDPDKSRKVGSIQKDSIKSHNHIIYNTAGGKPSRYNIVSGGGWSFYKNNDLETTNFGGEETRPINVSLYTYIKISN